MFVARPGRHSRNSLPSRFLGGNWSWGCLWAPAGFPSALALGGRVQWESVPSPVSSQFGVCSTPIPEGPATTCLTLGGSWAAGAASFPLWHSSSLASPALGWVSPIWVSHGLRSRSPYEASSGAQSSRLSFLVLVLVFDLTSSLTSCCQLAGVLNAGWVRGSAALHSRSPFG